MSEPTQRILNEHWPFRDSQGRGHDEGVPMQRYPIDVGVHVVFSEDGRRNLWGWAIKWTKDAVCVYLDTEIHGYRRVWVAPCDVVRR
jgi:hypothetical protein